MNATFKFCLILLIISCLAYYLHVRTIVNGFEVISLHDRSIYKRPSDGKLKIKGKIGYTTIIWDNSGGVKISDSCCPNKTCVSLGRTTNSTIICIPNGIMVTPITSEYDAVSQ